MARHAGVPKYLLVALIVTCALPLAVAEEPGDPKSWVGVYFGWGEGRSGEREGILIQGVVKDSPAQDAGFRARDLIYAIDGVEVGGRGDLGRLVGASEPGSWVNFSVERQGREREIRVKLDERPTDQGRMEIRRGWIGVEAIDLPPALREHFGATEEAGVMISWIEPGSPAEAAGLQLGDVVYEIDGRSISHVKEFQRGTTYGGIGNEIELVAARWGAELVFETVIAAEPDGQP